MLLLRWVHAAYLLLGEREVCLAQVGLLPHGLHCCRGAHTRLLRLLLLPPLHVSQEPAQQHAWAEGNINKHNNSTCTRQFSMAQQPAALLLLTTAATDTHPTITTAAAAGSSCRTRCEQGASPACMPVHQAARLPPT